MNGKLFITNIFAIVFLLLVSCSNSDVFCKYYSFPIQGWARDNGAEFEVNIKDDLSKYDIVISMRNNDRYTYTDIGLLVAMEYPDKHKVTDTLRISLANENGEWEGNGLSIYTLNVAYKNKFVFSQKGDYIFSVKHIMASSPLCGISDIGLKIRKTDN
jgi:gliding motility-associated lipoprotein GldH